MDLTQVVVMSWMMSWLWLLMFVGMASTNMTLTSASGLLGIAVLSSMTAKLQSSSRSHIMRSLSSSIQSTEERIQPSSRRLLAVTSATLAMTTSSLTYPTLDQSFATNSYWLKVDINVQEEIDVKQKEFLIAMETGLATAYSAGKARKDAREAAVQELLEKLNPDNDPLLNIRRKRAVTIDGNTAQVIDLSRDITYPVNVALVFYIAEEDTIMPAGESKRIFSELSLQEMTLFLQVVVKSFPTEFIEPVTIPTTPAPSLMVLWIILGILGGLMLMCLGCCCCFCFFRVCCCRPLKSPPDGPMDMDTLKMLQHKQKYPYKPYKTPNQTPRGFDVAKETDGTIDTGVAREASSSGSGVRLQSSGTGSILKKQFNSVNTRVGVDHSSSSDISLSDNIPEVPPLELKVLQEPAVKKSTAVNEEDAFHQASTSLKLNSGGRSQRSSGLYQPRLLPLRTQISHDGDQWNCKSEHRKREASSPSSPHSLSTSRETEELRRIYLETQREITRVLEPDIIPDQSDRTYVAPDRRVKAQGKSSKWRRKTEMQETEFKGKSTDQMLPDTHYARRPSKKQTTAQRQPEAVQEARRKVHNLIDEAFSLVGLPKNAISPAPPLTTSTPPLATDQGDQANNTEDSQSLFQRKVSLSNSAVDVKEVGTSSAEQSRQIHRRDLEEKGTRVVVIPIVHQPDKTTGLVWNPYNAQDELIQLQKSQQLMSVPGGIEMTQMPHQATSHLIMPHPVSIPETSRELRLKGQATPRRAEGENQAMNEGRLSNNHEQESRMDISLVERERKPSTGLRRPSTDSGTSKLHNTLDDPYLDPYLKNSFKDELNGTFTLSPRSDGLTITQEDPYAVALSRSSNKDLRSTKSQYGKVETNMLSTLPREHSVGKPLADGYDEFDVSEDVAVKDNSGQLVAAIRDELVRLAKRSGQHGGSS